MQTRQKRRILPDTMIQEIGRSVKCQKLNKFISRTPKLSVNKPNPLRGGSVPWRPPMAEWVCGHLFPSHSSGPEESHTPANPPRFPGLPRNCSPQGRSAQMWQEPAVPPQTPPPKTRCRGFVIGSVCAAAFFHRGIIPLLTLFFSASGSQKTAVTPLEEGRQMPSGLPPPAGGSVSPAGRKFLQIRAAERHTATIHSSLFTILFPLAPPGGIPRPSIPTPLPGIAKELLPAGALSLPGHGPCPGCVRVGLACPQILSANCSPQGQGASLFHGDMIK